MEAQSIINQLETLFAFLQALGYKTNNLTLDQAISLKNELKNKAQELPFLRLK